MLAIKDKITMRVLLQEGDINFAHGGYIEYRWTPRDRFKENSFYVYGDKMAFLKFSSDDLTITVIKLPSAAAACRDLFDFAWGRIQRATKKASWNDVCA